MEIRLIEVTSRLYMINATIRGLSAAFSRSLNELTCQFLSYSLLLLYNKNQSAAMK